jgi:hypothetical protein
MNDPTLHPDGIPPDVVPTWVKILQAAIIGVVAGLALNALLSTVSARGDELSVPRGTPKQCKKQPPARDAVAPRPTTPSVGAVRWTLEGQSAWLQPFEIPSGN